MKLLFIIMFSFFCNSQSVSQDNLKSLHDFKAEMINGELLDFSSLKGKKVLIVNTASYCGLTYQYQELESLYQNYRAIKTTLLPRAIKLADWKELTPPLIAAAIGCFFGVSFLVSNEPDTITSLMGIILILASLMLLSGWKYSGPHNTYAGLAVGGLSGGSLGAFGVPVGQFFALYFLSSSGDTAKQQKQSNFSSSSSINLP